MNTGSYVRKVRKDKGLTQEKLAELAGVNVRTIRRIEDKEDFKEIRSLRKVLYILDITKSEIFGKDIFKLNYRIYNDNSSEVLNEPGHNDEEVANRVEDALSEVNNLVNKENYNRAFEVFISTSKLFEDENIYLNTAQLCYKTSQYAKAVEFADRILQLKLLRYEALQIKGVSLAQLKDYRQAVTVLEEALAIKENYMDYYNLGTIYYMMRNYSEAINQYEKCLSINSNYAEAHLNISVCNFYCMNYDLFIYHVNEALRLQPDMYEAYRRKGEYHRFLEEYNEAVKYFRLCLNLNPENYEALLGISISLQMNNQMQESTEYFKKLFALHSDRLFKNNKEKAHIVDVGHEKTSLITFEKIAEDMFKVYINNRCMPVNLNDDGNNR